MNRLLTILIGTLGLLTLATNSYACDDNASRLVAKTYMLANPVLIRENEIIPLIQSNLASFNPGGRAIRCMQKLGAALSNNGLAQFQQNNGNAVGEGYAGAMPEGLEHLPGDVADSLNSYVSDVYAMGQELIWLANVLPSIAQGNYTPYNSTGTYTRQMLRQVWPIYQHLCQIDPSSCQPLFNTLNQVSPQLELQIYSLALQLGN